MLCIDLNVCMDMVNEGSCMVCYSCRFSYQRHKAMTKQHIEIFGCLLIVVIFVEVHIYVAC